MRYQLLTSATAGVAILSLAAYGIARLLQGRRQPLQLIADQRPGHRHQPVRRSHQRSYYGPRRLD